LTDGEDHEPMTSPLNDPGNCRGLIEDEQDSGSEACVTTLDNGTEPSVSGSACGLPYGKLNLVVSINTQHQYIVARSTGLEYRVVKLIPTQAYKACPPREWAPATCTRNTAK